MYLKRAMATVHKLKKKGLDKCTQTIFAIFFGVGESRINGFWLSEFCQRNKHYPQRHVTFSSVRQFVHDKLNDVERSVFADI